MYPHTPTWSTIKSKFLFGQQTSLFVHVLPSSLASCLDWSRAVVQQLCFYIPSWFWWFLLRTTCQRGDVIFEERQKECTGHLGCPAGRSRSSHRITCLDYQIQSKLVLKGKVKLRNLCTSIPQYFSCGFFLMFLDIRYLSF